jgi:hypothetical protein
MLKNTELREAVLGWIRDLPKGRVFNNQEMYRFLKERFPDECCARGQADVYAQSSPPTKMMVNYRCGPQYSHMRFRWILRADRVKRNRAADAEQFHKGAEGPFRQELSACPNREDSWGAFPEQADVESRGCSKQTPRDHKVSRTSTGNEYPH